MKKTKRGVKLIYQDYSNGAPPVIKTRYISANVWRRMNPAERSIWETRDRIANVNVEKAAAVANREW